MKAKGKKMEPGSTKQPLSLGTVGSGKAIEEGDFERIKNADPLIKAQHEKKIRQHKEKLEIELETRVKEIDDQYEMKREKLLKDREIEKEQVIARRDERLSNQKSKFYIYIYIYRIKDEVEREMKDKVRDQEMGNKREIEKVQEEIVIDHEKRMKKLKDEHNLRLNKERDRVLDIYQNKKEEFKILEKKKADIEIFKLREQIIAQKRGNKVNKYINN